MNWSVTCSVCGQIIAVSDRRKLAILHCPHCNGPIANPHFSNSPAPLKFLLSILANLAFTTWLARPRWARRWDVLTVFGIAAILLLCISMANPYKPTEFKEWMEPIAGLACIFSIPLAAFSFFARRDRDPGAVRLGVVLALTVVVMGLVAIIYLCYGCGTGNIQ